MHIKILKLLSLITLVLFCKAHADTFLSEEEQIATESYTQQADSCKNGIKVPSYLVIDLIEEEDGLEKLKALLEHDCIEGFRNSIGCTIADDWARLGQSSLGPYDIKAHCAQTQKFIASWVCYFVTKLIDWVESHEDGKQAKDSNELKKKLKNLVTSEWFTEDMCDQIGLTEFDMAFLKEDTQKIVDLLNDMTDLNERTPAENAELFRFMTFATPELQHLVMTHENYSEHMISSSIMDSNVDTLIIISGPGGTAWSYPELNHAINRIEQLGLNWILLGNGVRSISLEDLWKLEPLINGLTGKLMFWIHAHGLIDEESGKHTIELTKYDVDETAALFEVLKNLCGNQAIDLILDACYSGKAYTDAIEILPEGSRFLSSASMNETSIASGKLTLNGVDHFMKSHSKFNSIFELFSLGYLYKTIDIKKGPQIFTLVSPSDPFVLQLDHQSLNFVYVHKNKEKIINYLKDYIDEETLELVIQFISLGDICPKKKYGIDRENLSRIIQYAVAMTCNND